MLWISVYEALTMMLTFGMLIITLINQQK
ncbi:putative holin-like toxin [Pullulanibacillus camelliae]